MWNKIEHLLIKNDLNQNRLAIKMGVSAGVINDLKMGRIKSPSFELVCKLADALGVTTDYFREKRQ